MPDPKIDKFKKVLQMDPNDETLWFGLGKAYMGDENWEEAISALESCLAVKPTYSAAILALAQSLNAPPNRINAARFVRKASTWPRPTAISS